METAIASWSVLQACLVQIVDFGLRSVLFPSFAVLAFPIMHLISHLPLDLALSRVQNRHRQCSSVVQLPTFGALGTVELAFLTVLQCSADGTEILVRDVLHEELGSL